MAETVTNRCKYRALLALMNALGANASMGVILGTQVGVHNPDLNTVADLDAVASVVIHTERLPLSAGTVTEDDTADRSALDYGNVTFAATAATTAQGVFLYDATGGTDATRDLLAVYTTGFPKPMDGGLAITVSDLLRQN